MVHLFNISVNDDTVSCDYTPETSNDVGHVDVDITSEEITNVQFSEYEYGKSMYVAHVRSKLLELVKLSEPIPSEATAIWF